MVPKVAYERRAAVQFLDVRTPHEFEAGHIEGARHIPVDRLPGYLHLIDNGRPVVVVCQVGLRSDMAAHYMRAKGFDAHNLAGGVDRWIREGLPIVTSDGRPGMMVDPWPDAPPIT